MQSYSTPKGLVEIVRMPVLFEIKLSTIRNPLLDVLLETFHTIFTQFMICAMIESRLATTAAAHFVAGLGGFRYIDLDTPMLLADDPFAGGYEQRGVVYDVSSVKSGLGIERK